MPVHYYIGLKWVVKQGTLKSQQNAYIYVFPDYLSLLPVFFPRLPLSENLGFTNEIILSMYYNRVTLLTFYRGFYERNHLARQN